MQGIAANKVDLSNEVLNMLPGLQGRVVVLLEVPEDLRLLKAQVCELKMYCQSLAMLPE